LKHLDDKVRSTTKFIASIPEARLLHRYAEGKWTIKEILAHILDYFGMMSASIFTGPSGSRGTTPQNSRDRPNRYAQYSEANQREIRDLLHEFRLVRQSTIAFFNSLKDAVLVEDRRRR
jgi:uncharacterized damage-inducible protein DinB